jgi:cbb3-type cytochrome oxidase cytochrome c subunit
MNEDKKVFPCYSMPLYKFLKDNGLRYEIKGKNVETDNLFYLYMYDDRLKQLLKKWTDDGIELINK